MRTNKRHCRSWSKLSWLSAILLAVVFSAACRPGCHADETWRKQLFAEVRVGNLPSVESLLSAENCPAVVGKDGESPLMIAAANGHYEVAKRLLEYGVKVDAKQKDGYTALMYAAEACQPRLVKLLIKSGAYIPMRSFAGKTSFEIAKERADFFRSAGSGGRSGLTIEQRWQIQHHEGPPPKPTCAEVSHLLEAGTPKG